MKFRPIYDRAKALTEATDALVRWCEAADRVAG